VVTVEYGAGDRRLLLYGRWNSRGLAVHAGVCGRIVAERDDPITVTPLSTGNYSINFPGLPSSLGYSDPLGDSNVKVTAHGWNGEYCNVLSWGPSSSGSRVTLRRSRPGHSQ
jgi:hypothetical protein